MSTELVLIRHGETEWNVIGRYQGTSDIELNDLGTRQAQALADSMRGEQWDVIVSSPLSRAWNTALPVAETLGISGEFLIPDPRLMERAYGVAEGYTLVEREEKFPGIEWEGLESVDDLKARAVGAIEDYANRYPNGRIIMVAHGTWINAALEVLSNGEYGHGKSYILNTGRTYLTKTESGWSIGEVSATDHLSVLA